MKPRYRRPTGARGGRTGPFFCRVHPADLNAWHAEAARRGIPTSAAMRLAMSLLILGEAAAFGRLIPPAPVEAPTNP